MRFEVRGQDCPNGPFGLHVTICRGIDRQAGNVGADGAAGFSLEHNGKVDDHSTPASRRIRLPSRPASFLVCTATQTSLPVVGCFSTTWLPFPDRTSTNPTAFSLRITSA